MRTLWGSDGRSAGVGTDMSLTSPHRETTADVQRLARYIRGVLAGEEDDRGRDLLGLARATQGGRVDHRRLQALAQLAEHRRRGVEQRSLDRPRRDGVAAHAVARALARDRLGEADHARLRRGVDGGALRADAAGLAPDVDYRPRSA